MTTVMARPRDRQVHVPSHSRAFDIRGVTYGLSTALAVVTLAATACTFFVPDVLRGTEVMNGSARGTALVALVLGVPTLVLAMHAAAIGSARGVFVWFGAVLYLAYNAFLLLLATPYNQLFLLYVAMAGIHQLWTLDPRTGDVAVAAGTTNEGLLDGPAAGEGSGPAGHGPLLPRRSGPHASSTGGDFGAPARRC